VSEQYASDVNFRARLQLHQRFSTATEDWQCWLFDRVAPPAGARILEVGCGPAEFWKHNLDRIDPTWRLTLTDLSPGMIEVARTVLGDRPEYLVADVEDLPFPDGSFDTVLANHMLYHVPDRPKAFAEIRRVLAAGGCFHATTNGRGFMQELVDLVGPEWAFPQHIEEFGLETGPDQLGRSFSEISVERFPNSYEVTEVEPVLAYVRSSSSVSDGTLERVRNAVEEAIARDGAFRITGGAGLINCRKP
jgi:SAM-dependent methyltransferase